jgi:hypothetical protein
MKRLLAMILAALSICAAELSAQYQMTLQNAVQLSSTVFQFDVYIVSTGANFNLTSYALQLGCAGTITNGGSPAISYVASSSALSFAPAGVFSWSGGGTTYLDVASNAGSQTVSTTPLKVGTFRITNTVPFGTTPAAMTWDFSGPYPTMVNINNANLTVPASHINALAPYRIIAQNDVAVNATTYEFDVDIVRTSADFTLTSYQLCFSINSAVVNGGTLTFSFVPGTTTLSGITPLNPIVVSDGGSLNLVCGSTPGSQTVTVSALKIGRFRVTNTVPFGVASMNVGWDFAGTYVTQVNINNSNVALPANHLNLLGNTPLPVELASFTAANANDQVQLKWTTAAEVNNYGFDIERKPEAGDWQKIDFKAGRGTTNAAQEYAYTDKNPIAGKIQYRLKQIDNSGKAKYYSAIDVTVAPPHEYRLMQNFPNPFNPTTSIKFQLPAAAFVTITVYDMLGREVSTLVNEEKQAGTYAVEWDGKDGRGMPAASGVYIYRLSAAGFAQAKKMNYVR